MLVSSFDLDWPSQVRSYQLLGRVIFKLFSKRGGRASRILLIRLLHPDIHRSPH